MRSVSLWAVVLTLTSNATALANNRQHRYEHPRASFVAGGLSSVGAMLLPAQAQATEANNFRRAHDVSRAAASAAASDAAPTSIEPMRTVIYTPLSIDVDGIRVPIAAWHSASSLIQNGEVPMTKMASYDHRIAVSKIGKLLAGWSLPSFVDREFNLKPTADGSQNVQTLSFAQEEQLPQSAPVVLMAHGYLGSRFDLSHLGEALASEGFLVLAAEYPESLAASYDARLLQTLTTDWNVKPTKYGIVGHSLGCGTVDRTGDESWTRVCLAGGYPSLRGPNCLFIGSVNDGAVAVGRALEGLREGKFEQTNEQAARSQSWGRLPGRASLIFSDPATAPNHISFLSEMTNDAMIDFLSPLLPLARALKIPVLDFDKYQVSRDSKATGEVVIPLVVDYLKQKMAAS
ncbi:hypothetical protein ACHAXT_005565 [Thalassiosira profunda]